MVNVLRSVIFKNRNLQICRFFNSKMNLRVQDISPLVDYKIENVFFVFNSHKSWSCSTVTRLGAH